IQEMFLKHAPIFRALCENKIQPRIVDPMECQFGAIFGMLPKEKYNGWDDVQWESLVPFLYKAFIGRLLEKTDPDFYTLPMKTIDNTIEYTDNNIKEKINEVHAKMLTDNTNTESIVMITSTKVYALIENIRMEIPHWLQSSQIFPVSYVEDNDMYILNVDRQDGCELVIFKRPHEFEGCFMNLRDNVNGAPGRKDIILLCQLLIHSTNAIVKLEKNNNK
ncbi:hypothetical protein LCGC14_3155050, partial [marine sediment metagenome]